MKRGLIKWLILVALFGAILVSPFTNRNKVNIQTQTPTTVQQTIDYKEVIIQDLKQINKLEVFQNSMKEEVEIKARWDNFLFKNTQQIQIRGNGIYKLDLDKFEVIMSYNEATIIADIETSVEIYDVKTQTEKGWLVMYDREFTSEQYSDMILRAKDKMNEKMKDDMEIVKNKAEEVIKTKVKEKGVLNVRVIWR